MSCCYIFCDSDEQADHIHEFLHEPLKKLVRGTGWYINVHVFNPERLQVMLYDKGYKNRYFFRDKYLNMPLILETAENKIYELINKKPLLSDNTMRAIQNGEVKMMTWEQYQDWKYGNKKV